MNQPTVALSTEPAWYRQFWPWFLIGMLGSVVLASFITLFIAVGDDDGVVVGAVASSGGKVMAEIKDAARGATVTLDPKSGILDITLAKTQRLDSLQMTLLHPTRKGRDLTFELERVGPDQWMTEIPAASQFPASLRWRWVLNRGSGVNTSMEPWSAHGTLTLAAPWGAPTEPSPAHSPTDLLADPGR